MVSVVLLGAGASYGSVDAIPAVPPLGQKLFDALEETGGVASGLSPELKKRFRDDFEDGMAAYEDQMGDVMAFHRDLAHYLAQFIPGPRSVYRKLIQSLKPKRVVYCSLNYDLLFEEAAAGLGFSTSYSTDHRDHFVRLLKPHGSSNFWPDIGANKFIDCHFAGNKVDVEAPVVVVDRAETIRRCLAADSLAPAMSMYAKGKAVKASPHFVDMQQRMWLDVVQRAVRVFIVGVRVHPPDGHIWDVLASSKAEVIYFGLEGDRPAFEQWQQDSRKRATRFVKSNFSDSVPKIRALML